MNSKRFGKSSLISAASPVVHGNCPISKEYLVASRLAFKKSAVEWSPLKPTSQMFFTVGPRATCKYMLNAFSLEAILPSVYAKYRRASRSKNNANDFACSGEESSHQRRWPSAAKTWPANAAMHKPEAHRPLGPSSPGARAAQPKRGRRSGGATAPQGRACGEAARRPWCRHGHLLRACG